MGGLIKIIRSIRKLNHSMTYAIKEKGYNFVMRTLDDIESYFFI